MRLIYVFHSGFILEGEDFILVIDYCRDSREEKEGVVHDLLTTGGKKWYVLVSHRHADHFNPEILQWKRYVSDIHYIFSRDVRKKLRQEERDGIVFLSKNEKWEDDRVRLKVYGSTDVGVSFYIDVAGKKVFHAGDLNNWHWKDESTLTESEGYEQDFLRELKEISEDILELDLAMFPIDSRLGSDYMRGALQFIEHIRIKWFAPMHFWEKYDEANAFLKYAQEKGIHFIAWHRPGQSMELD